MLDLLLIQQNDQDFRGMTNVCGISRLISIGDALTRKAASSGNHSELEFPMYMDHVINRNKNATY